MSPAKSTATYKHTVDNKGSGKNVITAFSLSTQLGHNE